MLWIKWEEAWSGGVSSTLSPGCNYEDNDDDDGGGGGDDDDDPLSPDHHEQDNDNGDKKCNDNDFNDDFNNDLYDDEMILTMISTMISTMTRWSHQWTRSQSSECQCQRQPKHKMECVFLNIEWAWSKMFQRVLLETFLNCRPGAWTVEWLSSCRGRTSWSSWRRGGSSPPCEMKVEVKLKVKVKVKTKWQWKLIELKKGWVFTALWNESWIKTQSESESEN